MPQSSSLALASESFKFIARGPGLCNTLQLVARQCQPFSCHCQALPAKLVKFGVVRVTGPAARARNCNSVTVKLPTVNRPTRCRPSLARSIIAPAAAAAELRDQHQECGSSSSRHCGRSSCIYGLAAPRTAGRRPRPAFRHFRVRIRDPSESDGRIQFNTSIINDQ